MPDCRSKIINFIFSKTFVEGNIWFCLFSLFGFTNSVKEYALSHKNIALVSAKDTCFFRLTFIRLRCSFKISHKRSSLILLFSLAISAPVN